MADLYRRQGRRFVPLPTGTCSRRVLHVASYGDVRFIAHMVRIERDGLPTADLLEQVECWPAGTPLPIRVR